MTERRRASVWTIATLSLGAFLVVLALLAWRMHSGTDPALRSGTSAQDVKHRVLVRRIVERVVVTRVIPAPAAAGRAPSAPAAAPTTAPTPAAPAPAPAPTAAPPPPVSRAS